MNHADCFARFLAAVRAAREGNYRPGKDLIESVRASHGDDMAEIQRRELKRYVESKERA